MRPGDNSLSLKNDNGKLTIYQKDDDGKRYYTKLVNHKKDAEYNTDNYGYWYYSSALNI